MKMLPLLLLLLIGPAAAQNKATARREIGKPVQEAQQFLKQKKFKEALTRLVQADKVADKTPYERYIIAATRAAADLDGGDEPAAIEALVLLMTDEERAVRHAAELALGRIDVNWLCSEAAQRAIPQLEAAQNDQRGWVRSAAAQLLTRLHMSSADMPAAG
jgi:hypothetical protein